MKTLISLLTLAAIVLAYFFSTSLYLQGQFFGAYALVLSAICSIVLWIYQVPQPKKQHA